MVSMTRWLDVEVGTHEIDLNTLPSNLALVDLHNDNEFKLLVGDLGRGEEGPKLKIFVGAMQVSDMVLPDLPLGVVGFYTVETNPRSMPIIAVAFSSSVYIYRNMKLFYKYYLPTIELSICELEVWKQLINPENHTSEAITLLTEKLKAIPMKILTMQSQNFIAMTSDQQLEYLEQMNEVPTKKVPEVACITTLKMSSVEQYAVSCLVVGSEDGEVFLLDPQTFTQLAQAKLCAVKRTPYQMVTTGLFTVDYRITIATREKSVCVMKRGWPEGRILFSTDDHIVSIDVMPNDNSVIVICADHTLTCYSKKGKKQWSLTMEHRPVALTLLPVLSLGVTLTAVALASGHVHLYDGKARRDTLFVRGGNLMLKILKRTADFNAHAAGVEAVPGGNIAQKPWLIPKKSKLFIEQSVRERENAIPMHESFQRELSHLRLWAARALLSAHERSDNCVAVGALEPVRLAAEVPLLSPGAKLQFPTKIEEVFDDNVSPEVFFRTVTGQGGERSLVKILLLKEGLTSPVLAATVQMPPTDPMMLPYEKMQETGFENKGFGVDT